MKLLLTRAFLITFAVLVCQKSFASDIRCEAIFSTPNYKADSDVKERRSTFFAPQNTPQRVLRERILNEHFFKRSRRVAKAMAAAPVEAIPPERDWTPTPTVRETFAARPVIRADGGIFKIFDDRVISVQWVGNENILVSGPHQKYGSRFFKRTARFLANKSEARIATLVSIATGEGRDFNVFKSDGVSESDSFFIAEEAGSDLNSFTYRFLDKKTLEDIREPLVDINDLEVHGRFITYEDTRKQHVISSIDPSDFGLSQKTPVVRNLSNTIVSGVSNDGSIVIFSNHWGKSGFDPRSQTYGPNPAAWPIETFKDGVGSDFDVVTLTNFAWQVLNKATALYHMIEVHSDDRKALGAKAYARVSHILGSGSSHFVMIEVLDAPKGKVVGVYRLPLDEKILSTKKVARYDSSLKVGDRIMMLQRNGTLSGDRVAFVDLKTGALQHIGWFDPVTTVMNRMVPFDETRYFTVRHWQGTEQADLITYKGNNVDVSRYYQGVIELVRGTSVIRVWGLEETQFIDILSREVLWKGSTKALPSVSPDGSRIAFIDNGKLKIELLGKNLQSRVMFK